MSVAQRLEQARIAAGYRTAKEFADKNAIPQSTYQLHETGKRGLSRGETLKNYARLLGVREAWLLLGEGRMREADQAQDAGNPQQANSPVDKSQRRVEPETRSQIEYVEETSGLSGYPRTLKILGHVRAGVEGFFLDQGEVQGMAPRPPALQGVKNAFAARVRDDSMFPAYEPDDLVFVNPALPVIPPVNVIIEMKDGQAFIKRLIRRTEKAVICKQWNPEQEVRYDPKKIKAIYRILRPKEWASS